MPIVTPRPPLLLALAALCLHVAYAEAGGPKGGKIARGSAKIDRAGNATTVRQTSKRAVIDWDRFDVGRDHRVDFDQPGRDAATLNRVTAVHRSVIEGTITAPGTVVIQNGAGVLFTGSARIDTGSLVATSQTIDPGAFQETNRLVIGGGERAGARVANEGEISIGEAGLAALVGTDVENAGAIVAPRGTVALASGTRATIDLSGDGTVQIAVSGGSQGGGARNSGTILAEAGHVLITAGDAASTLDGVINTGGVVRAGSAQASGGTIEILGRGEGRVTVAGRLELAGRDGGTVTVTGAEVEIAAAARVDARGARHGGTALLGGDYQGGGPLRRADHLVIADGAVVRADGDSGNGGTVVAWSDGDTMVDGRITATGGNGGGLVETSGKLRLGIGGDADIDPGQGGQWLLDPVSIDIVSDATPSDPYTVRAGGLARALDRGSDVTVITLEDPSSDLSDLTISGALSWSGSGDLRLDAARDLLIRDPITTAQGNLTALAGDDIEINAPITATGPASFRLEATGTAGLDSSDIRVTRDIRLEGGGSLDLISRAGDVWLTGRPGQDLTVSTATGRLTLNASASATLDAGDGAVALRSAGGALSVNAGDAVGVLGDSAGAEVIAEGGALAVDTGTLDLSGASLIAALEGARLTLRAPTQNWGGDVRAGDVAAGGGDVLIEGEVTASAAPVFRLAPGHDFRLTGGGFGGPVGFTVTTSGTGTVAVDSLVAATEALLVSEAEVTIGADGGVRGTAGGDAVVVAAGASFDNAGDSTALAAPDGRFLLYLDDFGGLTGAAPGPREFDLYSRVYADAPPDTIGYGGNRVVYGATPMLVLTADTLTKTYGTEVEVGWFATGLRAGDRFGTALADGTSAGSTGATAGADAGSYATQVAAAASAQGYDLVLEPGSLTVTPAALTVAAADATRTVGTANPDFAATYSGFVNDEDAGDLDGRIAFATAATSSSAAGSYTITPAGLSSGNYVIDYRSGVLTVTPAVQPPLAPPEPASPSAEPGRAGFVVALPERGPPPLTPGDAGFRTTQYEAPPALSGPFRLSYSLGEIVQLAPTAPPPGAATAGFVPAAGAAADSATEGFVPAAGGVAGGATEGFVPAAGDTQTIAGGCAGPVNRGETGCGLQASAESYWTSTGRAGVAP